METRSIGTSGPRICPFVIGGHGLLGGFQGRPEQTREQAAQTLTYLVQQGLTHFDYTFAAERRAYAEVLRLAKLEGKLKPIIWYMDQLKHEGRGEQSARELVDNVRFHLDELGCEQAGAVIKWDNRWPTEWPAWTLEGLGELKHQGLTETVGLGILAGARANEAYLAETWEHWDFIAPYWNYSLRRAENLVGFARERGLGVYSVGAFLRGAVFHWPEVDPASFVRPWLKWILREPACFGFALSVQDLQEARQVVEACDGKPMSWSETQYFYDRNFPIQHVDYRIPSTGESAAAGLVVVEKEEQAVLAEGTNMLSGSLIKWR
jgi:hypothetical protein